MEACAHLTLFGGVESCNYLHLFFNSAYSPSPVPTICQDSLILSKTSRAGSSYQKKGVEDVSWLERSLLGSGDPHSRNRGKRDILLVLLVSSIQLLEA